MIKELQNRGNLGEGRNYGVGFSILKKINDNNFETYNAFTACKDYLNDLVFVENTKFEINKVHGFKHELQNIFDDKETFFIGICPLHYTYKNYEKFDEINNFLQTNDEYIKMINNIEELFNIENKSKIYSKDDITHYNDDKCKGLVIEAPIYWVKYPHIISLYTLLLRTFINCKKGDDIFKKEDFIIIDDKYMFTSINKLSKLKSFDTLLKYYDYKKLKQKNKSSTIHNLGISSWLKELPNEEFKE